MSTGKQQNPVNVKTNARDIELERLRLKAERLQQLEDIKFVMSDPRGRRFVKRVMVMAGMDQTTYSGDTEAMLINEGLRRMGLWLQDEILALPHGLALKHEMELENR